MGGEMSTSCWPKQFQLRNGRNCSTSWWQTKCQQPELGVPADGLLAPGLVWGRRCNGDAPMGIISQQWLLCGPVFPSCLPPFLPMQVKRHLLHVRWCALFLQACRKRILVFLAYGNLLHPDFVKWHILELIGGVGFLCCLEARLRCWTTAYRGCLLESKGAGQGPDTGTPKQT